MLTIVLPWSHGQEVAIIIIRDINLCGTHCNGTEEIDELMASSGLAW